MLLPYYLYAYLFNLSYSDHCLAHYYLFYCTTGQLKLASEIAFCKMVDRNLELRNCTEPEILELLAALKQLQDDPISNYHKNRLIDEAIENFYAIGGYKQVLDTLLAQGITITKDNIKARARTLGIRSTNFVEEWTDAEVAIIKQNYAIGGYSICRDLLPNRSKAAIQARAKYLGILAPGPSKKNSARSSYELSILFEEYPVGGWKAVKKLLPNRSEKSIKHQANKRNIFVNKN